MDHESEVNIYTKKIGTSIIGTYTHTSYGGGVLIWGLLKIKHHSNCTIWKISIDTLR